MMAGGFLWWAVITALTAYPLWIMMPRFRLPNWAALLVIVPFGAIALLWVMAFRDRLRIPGLDT